MWLDSVIGYFSPRRGYERARYRQMRTIQRQYEAAAKGRRTAGWKAPSTSANTEARRDLETLRNRSRDLVRNNPFANRGVSLIPSNVVSKGIRPKFLGAGDKEALALWNDWYPTCDFEGNLDYYALQTLAMRSVVESGEVFIRQRFTRDGLKLQILEADFLASKFISRNNSNNSTIVQGIELDENGRRLAYHFYEDHPGNLDHRTFGGTLFSTVRVPAEEVIHLYRTDRPGQVRGVPWLAPVMLRLRDFDDYEDAQLMRQKIASCFSVFVRDAHQLDAPLTEEDKIALGEKVEPGQIDILPPGKDITLANPPGVENYKEYTTCVLRSIATGLGVSYEALTGDLSEVNFSSARMGFLEFSRNIDSWRESLMNQGMNRRAFSWFKNWAAVEGVRTDDLRAQWIAPKREMVDPTKEIPAKIKAIRAGIETLDDVITQQGKDPAEHLEEIKDTNELLDKLDLTLDSDPRKSDDNGNARQEGESLNGSGGARGYEDYYA